MQKYSGCEKNPVFMTFGQSYLTHMKCLEDVGMLRTDPIMVDGKEVVPLQVLKELLPDPASLGPRTVGKTNIGCIFNGIKDGKRNLFIFIMYVTIRNATKKWNHRQFPIQQEYRQ